MRQLNTKNLVPGMTIAQSVYPPADMSGIPLLAANVVVTESILQRIFRANIEWVVIDDEFSDGIELSEPLSDQTRREALSVLKSTFDSFGRGDKSSIAPEQIAAVESVFTKIMGEISSRPNLLVCLSDMNIFGDGSLQQALKVCVIGSTIAQTYLATNGWFDFRGKRRHDGIDERLIKLGVGMLLQDVGMMAIPPEIINKKGFLTSEERQIIQQHPILGLELLHGHDLSPLTKVTVAQHHERFDGTGYPYGLAGNELHDHGQIAAIAQAYTSLRFDDSKEDSTKLEPHEAYQIIVRSRDRMFRNEIVDAFVNSIAQYGVGQAIRLSDGSYGLIAENNPKSPSTPTVRVTHDKSGERLDEWEELDLASNPELTVATAIAELPTTDS